MFPPPALVPLVLSKFQIEHVKDQFRCLILVAPSCKEATWLPTVLNMLADVPNCYPIVQNISMDDSVDQVLKAQPQLYLTLAAQRYVLCRGVLLLSLSGSDRGDSSVYDKRYQQCLKQ